MKAYPGPTPAARSALRDTAKARPGTELSSEYLFRPIAHPIVLALLPLRVPPPAVVVVHAVMGLVAAGLILAGQPVAAASLLLAKTVLDAADGQLARASGRVTPLGRYLDTELDAVANVAIFAAIGAVTGRPWLALAAFIALTLSLSVDYVLISQSRGGILDRDPDRSGSVLLRATRSVYEATFAPQDRLLVRVDRRRLESALRGVVDDPARARGESAYQDPLMLSVVANLGLATQLLVLAVCLLVDAPVAYLWIALAGGLLVPALQLRRERRARHAALASAEPCAPAV